MSNFKVFLGNSNNQAQYIGQILDDTNTTKVNNQVDYVVAFQKPTSANNYTWYRKYASGWVEQGGTTNIPSRTDQGGSSVTVNLPITMANSNYSGQISFQSGGTFFASCQLTLESKTQSNMKCAYYMNDSGITSAFEVCWEVKGMAAS